MRDEEAVGMQESARTMPRRQIATKLTVAVDDLLDAPIATWPLLPQVALAETRASVSVV